MYLFVHADYSPRGEQMSKSTMNKVQLNTTVSVWAKQKADEYGASDGFSSTSNFVESAIIYYMGAIERENELKYDEYKKELQTKYEDCNKELQTKYEDCNKELQRLRDEYNKQSTMLIKLLSNHNDLIEEVNNLEKSTHKGLNYTKKVTFD
jgi:leucyl-tRNA synthetase